MPDFTFTEKAFAEYLAWQQDRQTMKRINMLLKDIARSPFEGVGKPEPLKYGEPGRWSRRINEADRLVYRIKDDAIIILQCKGHYDD